MRTPANKGKASRVVAAKIKHPPVDEDDELETEADESASGDGDSDAEADEPADPDDEDVSPRRGSAKYERKEVTGEQEGKGFFDQLGDTLRAAGKTAERYTRIGVSHASIEKLRFELKTAHAALGEVVMRCWSDAPDLGLTSRDPAIIAAYRRVKDVRRKIRELEAKIAALKVKP